MSNTNPKYKYLLPQLLQDLQPMIHKVGPCAADRWSVIFGDAIGDEEISPSMVCHIIAGRRCLPRKYVINYADPQHPHAPLRLRSDLHKAVSAMHTTTTDRRWLFAAIITYIQGYVDPIDQPSLLPTAVPNMPSIDDVVTLCCITMWYAMCHDFAI